VVNQPAAVEVRDLAIGYPGKTVQRNVSFRVRPGEILAVLGGSGSGKSTLMRHLIGLQPPLSGEIFIQGESLNKALEGAVDYQAILRRIGVMYQSGALLGSMTLAENVALPIEEYLRLSEEDVASLICIKLGLVNLHGFENHLPSQLSGGMVKRGAIARALALNPELLFLDEPSAGLDPVISAGIDELLVKINRSLGMSMIIVSHELTSILNIAHRVILLDARGEGILARGDPRELRRTAEDPYVQRFFNPEVQSW
jgi:phospholipid/cholesterol/gamma-HCH transport system ATP-binding protein